LCHAAATTRVLWIARHNSCRDSLRSCTSIKLGLQDRFCYMHSLLNVTHTCLQKHDLCATWCLCAENAVSSQRQAVHQPVQVVGS
jgi:hypothetical protein